MKTVLLSSLLSLEQKRDFSHIVFSYTIKKNTQLILVNDLLEHTNIPNVSHEIEIILEAHASLLYHHVIQEHNQQIHTYSKKFSQILAGEGATAQITMGYYLTKKQMCTVVTEQKHMASKTDSSLSLRTALLDQAHVHNSSMIFVTKNCHDIVTKQEHKSLMLSPQAYVITKPEIVIQSSRINCAHGATTSSINQEQLWYLKSRGIQKIDAQNLIINGFLGFYT